MQEPTLARYHGGTAANRLLTCFAATRPAFLSASLLPVGVGLALAWREHGGLQWDLALLTLLAMAAVHSGANVLNDYFDAENGTDAANAGRIFPFSGGSRFIQNGVLTAYEVQRLGSGLLVAGVLLGVLLALVAGPLLFILGIVGGLLAVFYSAPPCLAGRGFGDIIITLCFGVLPVAGTVYIQLTAIPAAAWWLGLIVGLFAAAILWINSIPDIDADRSARKWTLPARLGKRRARYGLIAWFVLGFVLITLAPLPDACRWALAAIVPAICASFALLSDHLLAAIPLTLLTHAAVCILLLTACLT